MLDQVPFSTSANMTMHLFLWRVLSCVWLFETPWTVACQAPLSMEFPNNNTVVGCHFLLQGIFPTQGSNLHLLNCRQILYLWDFPGGSDGKSICLRSGRPRFAPWVRKIPCRRKWQSILVFLPGKSHGRRSLVGYSPWGRKESDTTEQLHFLNLWATRGSPKQDTGPW